MKSAAVMGLPSDHLAFGLILYSIVCGLWLVTFTDVTKSGLKERFALASETSSVGIIDSMALTMEVSLPLTWLMFHCGPNWSIDQMTVPPSFRSLSGWALMLIAAIPLLVLGFGAALPPLLDPPQALNASAAVSGNASSAPRLCILTTTPPIVGLSVRAGGAGVRVTRPPLVRRSGTRPGGLAPSESGTGTGRNPRAARRRGALRRTSGNGCG